MENLLLEVFYSHPSSSHLLQLQYSQESKRLSIGCCHRLDSKGFIAHAERFSQRSMPSYIKCKHHIYNTESSPESRIQSKVQSRFYHFPWFLDDKTSTCFSQGPQMGYFLLVQILRKFITVYIKVQWF